MIDCELKGDRLLMIDCELKGDRLLSITFLKRDFVMIIFAMINQTRFLSKL